MSETDGSDVAFRPATRTDTYDIDWAALCTEAHQTSVAKGWMDVPRTFDGDVILMHEEISEAVSDYRDDRRLNEVYYEVKFKEDDGRTTQEIWPAERVHEARKIEGKYGRGREFMGAKPCGIPIELADLIIRIAQYSGTNRVDLARGMSLPHTLWKTEETDTFEAFARKAHVYLAFVGLNIHLPAFDEFRKPPVVTAPHLREAQTPEEEDRPLERGFSFLLHFVMEFCKKHDIDIVTAVKEKAAHNKSRPYRHGGRKI